MNGFSESTSEYSHFIFFNGYEEDRFDEFVEFVLTTLGGMESEREEGPYSTLVIMEYKGQRLVLTSGSFEGCFISMDKEAAWLAREIIKAF